MITLINWLPKLMSYFTLGGDVLGGVGSVLGGVAALTGGGNDAAEASFYDPFADYRDKIAKMYSGYLTPDAATNIYKMPGYTQFQTGVLDPAMDATKRSMAASGQLQSGNEQIALQKIGQQGYYGFMTDYLNRLAQASGASQNPAYAAGLAAQGGFQNQANMMGGIGAITGGLQNLYKGVSSGSYGGGSTYGSGTSGPGYGISLAGYDPFSFSY